MAKSDNISSKYVSAYNMMSADLELIDEARVKGNEFLLTLRYDVERALSFFDFVKSVYLPLKPIMATGENEKLFKQDIDEVEKLLKEFETLAVSELHKAKRLSKRKNAVMDYSPIPASRELLKKGWALLEKLYFLKHSVGLGIKQTREFNRDGAFGRVGRS